ncbi:MAG: PA14 domain-containing protein [Candidatus Bathyarchaeota archaeon]|nr:PA14 domain-containing protein [Candidatus Bathyarchaeota archaeon]
MDEEICPSCKGLQQTINPSTSPIEEQKNASATGSGTTSSSSTPSPSISSPEGQKSVNENGVSKKRKLVIVLITVIVLISVVIFSMVPIIKVDYNEPYNEVEHYIEVESYSVPQNTIWTVTWKEFNVETNKWGSVVGTSTFPAEFDYFWGHEPIYGEYDNWIGFIATAKIYLKEKGPLSFYLASDDGSKLYLDDTLLIDNWGQHSLYEKKYRHPSLLAGDHTLKIECFDAYLNAGVKFYADNDDLFSFEEVRYKEVKKTRMVTKNVTLLAWLQGDR